MKWLQICHYSNCYCYKCRLRFYNLSQQKNRSCIILHMYPSTNLRDPPFLGAARHRLLVLGSAFRSATISSAGGWGIWNSHQEWKLWVASRWWPINQPLKNSKKADFRASQILRIQPTLFIITKLSRQKLNNVHGGLNPEPLWSPKISLLTIFSTAPMLRSPRHHVLCVSHNRTSSAGAAASVGSAVAVAGVLATMAVRRGPLGTNLGGRGIRMCQVLSGLQSTYKWGSPRIDGANISNNVIEYFKKCNMLQV